MRWTPFIAAGGLAAVAAFVIFAGMRLTPRPEAIAPPAERSSGENDLRWHAAGPGDERQRRTVSNETPAEMQETPTLPSIAPPSRPSTQAAPRAIEPSVVAVPEISAEELERIDPRPALSPLPPPKKKKPPKPLLFQPVAESAGVISAGGRKLTIAGVEPLPDTETCEAATGPWPCGRAARTAFRGLLRARAVTCDFPEGEVLDEVTVACSVGRRDIGAWLVENGWAKPAGGSYPSEADAARQAKRGIYGTGPGRLPAAPSASAASNAEPAGDSAISTSSTDPGVSILPPAALDAAQGGASGQPAAVIEDPAAVFPEAPAAPGGVSPLPPPSSPRP